MDNFLFDSHCHFDFEAFGQSRDQLWQRCQEEGVGQLLVPGIHPQQWRRAKQVSHRYSGVVMAVGVHPWWLHSLPAGELSSLDKQQLLDYLHFSQCVAIGECGMDKTLAISLKKQQIVFEQHLQLAVEHSLPLIIHVQKTHNETLQLLKYYQPPAGGVIHGFSGSVELAQSYWRLGFYLGIGGVITYERASKTRNTVCAMPLESLLLETDAPDMPLQGYQGEPNSPLQLINVANTLASLRQQPLIDIAAVTTANTRRLFHL